jgi:hypothetical protein
MFGVRKRFERRLDELGAQQARLASRVESVEAASKRTKGHSHWELLLAAVAAIAAIGAAYYTRTQAVQAVDAETRTVSSDLLTRFDGMWEARLTLQRYHALAGGGAPDFIVRTRNYFLKHIYFKPLTPEEEASQKLDTHRVTTEEEFFENLDKSRRRVKNFYQDIKLFSDKCLVSAGVREKLFGERFFVNTDAFLQKYWLPVERAQNAALYKDDDAAIKKHDDNACDLVAWYRRHSPPPPAFFASCTIKPKPDPMTPCTP